jgi:hypothetical protein
MDIKHWVDLFGKAADDSQVRASVAKAGITKPLKIGRNELSVRADIKGEGTTIVFTDESLLRPDGGVARRPILSAVMAVIQSADKGNLYKGALPHGLKKSDSQTAVRARFGPPTESNEDNQTDAWLVDGLTLAVSFSEDLKSIIQLSLAHPDSQ